MFDDPVITSYPVPMQLFILGLLTGILLTLVLTNLTAIRIRYYKLRSEQAKTAADAALANGDKAEMDKQLARKAEFDAKIAEVVGKERGQ